MIGSIVSSVTGLLGGWLKNKAEKAQATHERQLSTINNAADWETKMAEASGDSWKDEYLILLLTLPMILIMYGALTNDPEIIARVKSGFAVLSTLPVWYQYLLGVGVTASFGVKGATKFMKLLGK